MHLDYFFAQCEELRNPALKKEPVFMGVYSGRSDESGAVSTTNYIARKFVPPKESQNQLNSYF